MSEVWRIWFLEHVKKQRALYGCNLYINTQGTVNYQSVGAASGYDMSGSCSLQVDDEGNLVGPAANSLRRLHGRFRRIYLLGATDEKIGDSSSLLLATAKAIGPGTGVIGTKSYLLYYSDNNVQRRATSSADMDRDALRDRLTEYVTG